MKLSFLCTVCVLTYAQVHAAFPTEAQVRSTLRRGMKPEEVTALYGTPGGGGSDGSGYRFFSYISPVNMRTREVEGYVGFKAFFKDGHLVSWEPINTIPSYDPDLHAREHLMPAVWGWALMFIALFGYGLFRAFGFLGREQRRIIEAYREREFPTRSLPPDFRFINRETTLQEVIERVGPPTRATPRVIRGTAAGFRTVEIRPGVSGVVTYEYELPYHAAVIVMPEHPFGPTDRIRAIYYRPPRTDEE